VRILFGYDTSQDSIYPFLYATERRSLLYMWISFVRSVIVIITNHNHTCSFCGYGLALIKGEWNWGFLGLQVRDLKEDRWELSYVETMGR